MRNESQLCLCLRGVQQLKNLEEIIAKYRLMEGRKVDVINSPIARPQLAIHINKKMSVKKEAEVLGNKTIASCLLYTNTANGTKGLSYFILHNE